MVKRTLNTLMDRKMTTNLNNCVQCYPCLSGYVKCFDETKCMPFD